MFAFPLLLLAAACGGSSPEDSDPPPFAWPPVCGESCPDLVLPDANGETVRLSSFRGKTLLIEPVGMT